MLDLLGPGKGLTLRPTLGKAGIGCEAQHVSWTRGTALWVETLRTLLSVIHVTLGESLPTLSLSNFTFKGGRKQDYFPGLCYPMIVKSSVSFIGIYIRKM